MPLSKIQTCVLRLLASHRDPESYVAGSTPLNREAPRYSSDIDVFHDREERVARAAVEDAMVLEAHGYTLTITAIFLRCGMRGSATSCTRWTSR